jgi:predicted ATPase/class 3 adenylate cyclase
MTAGFERPLRPPLPVGTVTFLRTDVAGSMDLQRSFGHGWDEVNTTHLRIIRETVDEHGGVTVRTEGDALFAAFPEAGAAVRAAADAQRRLNEFSWPPGARLRVRMGLHSGEAHVSGDDYGGFEVNRAARIAAVAHGGQIVLSSPTKALVAEALPPGATLRELGEHVLKGLSRPEVLYQLDIPGLRTVFPPLLSGTWAPGNLPGRMTSFIGRTADLAELRDLLESSRLVTLTGPGGIGKTSLGIELARGEAERFRDGTWFVPLDLLDEPFQVRGAIARTIGLFDGSEGPAADVLLTYLARRSVLLVLDNFEHVLDAAADVSSLLRASPASRVLVTSRAALRIPGEQEYPVPSLLPGPDGQLERDPAVQLFVERARAVRPGWDPDESGGVVSEICELLDGLPLGIELAATRVGMLPLTAIRDRLRWGMTLPGSGPRDIPVRQRTLETAIGWSYGLLSGDQQMLLRHLSVFDGSFDADQAAAVAGTADLLDDLMALVEQSLVVPVLNVRGDGVRARLLTTIKAFATERLVAADEGPSARNRHCIAYLDLAEAIAPELDGKDQARALDRMALDHANFRAALRWAIDDGQPSLALRFLPALWRFWQRSGTLHEGRALAGAALRMPGADAPSASRMWAVAAAGNLAYWQADHAAARSRYQEELELARELHSQIGEADALFNLAHVELIDSDTGALRTDRLRQARAKYESIGDARGMDRCDWSLATVDLSLGRVPEAASAIRTLLAQFQERGDVQYYAMAASTLGLATYALGDSRTAATWAIRGVVECYRSGDLATSTISLQEAALVAAILDRPDVAATLMAACESLCDQYGVRPPNYFPRFLGDQFPDAAGHDLLTDQQHEAAYERGRRMSLDDAISLLVEIGEEHGIRVESPIVVQRGR